METRLKYSLPFLPDHHLHLGDHLLVAYHLLDVDLRLGNVGVDPLVGSLVVEAVRHRTCPDADHLPDAIPLHPAEALVLDHLNVEAHLGILTPDLRADLHNVNEVGRHPGDHLIPNVKKNLQNQNRADRKPKAREPPQRRFFE